MSLDDSWKVTACGSTVRVCSCWLAAWVTVVWAQLSGPRPLHGLAPTRRKSGFCCNALEGVGLQAGSSSAPDRHPVPASCGLPASAIPRVLLYLPGGSLLPSTSSRSSPREGGRGRGTGFFFWNVIRKARTTHMHLHPTGLSVAAGGWGMACLVRQPHLPLKLGVFCSQKEEGGVGVGHMPAPPALTEACAKPWPSSDSQHSFRLALKGNQKHCGLGKSPVPFYMMLGPWNMLSSAYCSSVFALLLNICHFHNMWSATTVVFKNPFSLKIWPEVNSL